LSSERSLVGDAVDPCLASARAGTWPNSDAFPIAAMNPHAVLDAIGGALAESLGRRNGVRR
jgi:hypothetical protein